MQANDGLFGNMSTFQPPLTSDQFTETIVAEYADTIDAAGIDACIGAALDHVWPVVRNDADSGASASSSSESGDSADEHEEPPQIEPRDAVPSGDVAPTLDQADDYTWFPSYREHQREAVIDILHQLYVDDKDVVTLSAPTGAGKSLILHGAMAVLADVFSRQAFFTTPLNALIDQVDDDEFIEDHVITLKGKNNYSCVHPQDAGASVDNAICQRVDDFDCQYKDQAHTSGGCPYYGRKAAAQSHPEVVTNISYLMANSMIPETVDTKFDPRELLVIDECQSIEDFALQFIGVTVSQNSVPVVWERIDLPPQTEDVEQLAEWLEQDVLPPVVEKLNEFERLPELTEEQTDQQEKLQQFERKVNQLIRDVQSNHWVANREVEGDEWSVEFEPIFIGRFLEQFLWSQGQKVILSSATIPKGGFAEEIGLEDRQVGRVEVESTFPTERRPVYTDEAVGKMTMRQRDQTIPKMARRIGDLADHYWDEGSHRGFVHCHSYKIMRRIYDRLPADVRQRTRCQDPDAREASLDDWLDAPVDERGHADDEGGQVFLSVAQDEGISLDDWRARWQVIAKASYPYMGPEAKRANYRMDELDDWTWYAGSAAINLQQAAGRGMRSQDDWCHTHVLDSSAAQMIDRNEYLFEDWFLDAVDEAPSPEICDRA